MMDIHWLAIWCEVNGVSKAKSVVAEASEVSKTTCKTMNAYTIDKHPQKHTYIAGKHKGCMHWSSTQAILIFYTMYLTA